MGSAAAGYIWTMRGVYALLGLLILFIQLLPLETQTRSFVAPDFLLALTFVWVARRPDLAPTLACAALFLLADLLLQRPPGLWAGLALMATEALRSRADDLRDMLFSVEWAIASAFIAALYVTYAAFWALLMPYEITYWLLGLQMILTILSYPVLAGLSMALFGVAKAAPGQTDDKGRKL
ncbi:MAG: rod shape-determining protein MreD [Pseudomonadota bacterium]